MNRNIYRLVKNQFDCWVPVAEHVSGHKKSKTTASRALLPTLFTLTSFASSYAYADGGLPTPCTANCGTNVPFTTNQQAAYNINGNTGTLSQIVPKVIVNFRDFNVGTGKSVVLQQVHDLNNLQLVNGAQFSTLVRIYDSNPSVIAGAIHAAQGQSANLVMVNQNGFVFTGSSQIDLNSLTASALNVADKFFLDQLVPKGNAIPQFQNGLDGNPNTGGFIKVLEGAKISATSGGRVMLIAPTVTNRGKIDTPNGQTILAAGNKVFLTTSEDPALRGLLVEVDNSNLADQEYDKKNVSIPSTVKNPDDVTDINIADQYDNLGNATNLGEITAAKGNITMVGLAVNQMKRVSATTAYNANGSIYLTAKSDLSDPFYGDDTTQPLFSSKRAGRVTLGEGSVSQILIEENDQSKQTQDFDRSKLEVLGRDITVKKNAQIKVPSGIVNFTATLNPSLLKQYNPNSTSDPLVIGSQTLNDPTSIIFETGAAVDVSGLDVSVPVMDDFIKIKLLGAELADSPVNRNGILRGEEVWVDLTKGSPLVSNIAEYQKNLGRTIAYNSTDAGSVRLQSQGKVVVQPDAKFDMHGGKVTHTGSKISESVLIGEDGKAYAMSQASAGMKYTDIATQQTKKNGRFGPVEKILTNENIYNPGYVEGKNAGLMFINARQAYFAGSVDGSTTIGAEQAANGTLPLTAALQVGRKPISGSEEFGLNQNVIIGEAPSILAADNNLTADQQANLHLNASLFGGTGFSRINLLTNQSVAVNSNLKLADGGSFSATGLNVGVNANITTTAASVKLNNISTRQGVNEASYRKGRLNVSTTPEFNADIQNKSGEIAINAKDNVFNQQQSVPTIKVADGVTLSSSGKWVNDVVSSNVNTTRLINAGSIKLDADALNNKKGELILGDGSVLNVEGGAYQTGAGKLQTGKAGDITLTAYDIQTDQPLQNHMKAASFDQAGTVNVTSNHVQIGGTQTQSDDLLLDSGFFKQGFVNYQVTGLSGLTVADNTKINVQTQSLDFVPKGLGQATNTPISAITTSVTKADQFRRSANIQLAATSSGVGENATLAIGTGAEINTDTGANVTLKATKAVEVNGKVNAPAGTINVELENTTGFTQDNTERIHLGASSALNASGAAKVSQNSQGLKVGEVLSGGQVNIKAKTGYVDAEAGALIDVHGSAPVHLDVVNSTGRLGLDVASDAGSVNIKGETGIYLDNAFNAKAGSAFNNGGSIKVETTDSNISSNMHLGSFNETSPTDLQQTSQLNQAYVDLPDLEAAGFERISLRSSDQITLENGLKIGEVSNGQLKNVKLDAPNIIVSGGDASIHAAIVQVGNSIKALQGNAVTPVVGNNLLAVNADFIELFGNSSLSGVSKLSLNSNGELRLTGVQPSGDPHGIGNFTTTAMMDITANVISPASLTTFNLVATDNDIHLHRASGSKQIDPLSVLGNINITAKNIDQDGRIVAPFGTVTLNASETLNLGAGSITSVAGNEKSALPLGTTQNGVIWYIDVDNDSIADTAEVISVLPTKTVKLNGKNIRQNSGALVDIAGGGDIQATEFSSGTGGSTDILEQGGYYAILPDYNSIVAPTDADPTVDYPMLGQTVYLAGGNGLKAGNYTLLPAKYALLKGAYAIKVGSATTKDVAPNNVYMKADGTKVVAGFISDNQFKTTDTSAARWSGFELLTLDEVKQRSEYKISKASKFFANDGATLPADAGALQINVAQTLALNGILNTTVATGARGASVDIAATKLAVVDKASKGNVASDEVALDIDELNALHAESLLLGGIREVGSNKKTKLNVIASNVRMDSQDSNAALVGPEVMLTAKDEVLLQHNSTITADGSVGNAGTYTIEGNAALVRAAATEADVLHSGTPDRTTGNINSDATVKISASKAITLDATGENAYQGNTSFTHLGQPVKGLLSLGANAINFGAVPNGTQGLLIDQARLDQFNGLDQVVLRSYSTFDFYGNTKVGEYNATDGYSINSLSLEGAGLRAMGAGSDQVSIQAKSLALSNPNQFIASTTPAGNNSLVINTDTLKLGQGDKTISGFANTTFNAVEIIGDSKGKLDLGNSVTTLNTARLTGESGANQSINTTGALVISKAGQNAALQATKSIASTWSLAGGSVNLDSELELHGGSANITATNGDVILGDAADIDVSGQVVEFFDQKRVVSAGNISLDSKTGNVKVAKAATLNVSAVQGGDAGALEASAVNGEVDIADANIVGGTQVVANGSTGKGSSVVVDAKTITNFDGLNTKLNAQGFNASRDYRLRTGNLNINQSGENAIRAHQVTISVDNGSINVTGEIDASGNQSKLGDGGKIALYAGNGLTLSNTANVHAEATKASGQGGQVILATKAGSLDLQAGGKVNVSGGSVEKNGEVLLRAPRVGNSVAVSALNSEITGASSTVLEAVKTYTDNDFTAEDASTTKIDSSGFAKLAADVSDFMANKDNIVNGLGKSSDTRFHLRAGVEVDAEKNLKVGGVGEDWSLYEDSRSGNEPGTLTLRSAKDLTFDGSLSDGFTSAGTDAVIDPNKQDSWSYRLVAGADMNAANVTATNKNGTGDFKLAANKLIRTGTGDIEIVAGGNFDLGYQEGASNQQTGVIYTAGKIADDLSDFVYLPQHSTRNFVPLKSNNFTQDGGDISINVAGDVRGALTNQLYSNWLFRQGQVNDEGAFDSTHPQTAWWVRFDRFQQGVGALGGGNVNVMAGGDIENLSVSSVTNGRMNAVVPSEDKLVVLGGGDVNIQAGNSILGGQFYAAKGTLSLSANEEIKEKEQVGGLPLYTTIALGDAQANIQAGGHLNIEAIINPTLVQQTFGTSSSVKPKVNITNTSDIKKSVFSTYTDASSIALTSLAGDVNLHNSTDGLTSAYNNAGDNTGINWDQFSYKKEVLSIVPGSLTANAFTGDINVKGGMMLSPSSLGTLELLAQQNINIGANVGMSDADVRGSSIASGLTKPLSTGMASIYGSPEVPSNHALVPVHANDAEPVRVYAVEGDIAGTPDINTTFYFAKAAHLIAGQDFTNLGVIGQNIHDSDVTSIKTGRDLLYTSDAQWLNKLQLGGAGRFEFEVGRNLDLGKSLGISTVGNIVNSALSSNGADVQIAVGVPNGVDYSGTVDRLLTAINQAGGAGVSDSTLWQVRWLTGNSQLENNAASLLAAVQETKNQGAEVVRTRVRSMFYQALLDTGTDHNNPDSTYAGEYTRGYDTIALVFPGIDEKNTDGTAKNYVGNLSLPLTSIKTNAGGDIEYMLPGGGALIGYEQVSDAQLPSNRTTVDTGIVVLGEGSVRGFTRDSQIVNQSRVLTVGGGDILLWSSEGDLDAGKGKRTAVSVPPPVISVDAQGNVKVVLQGAATGSGIGALGADAGNVDLIAPNGTVNAGDAGVRAKNVNIAAQTVLNAANISASGSATGTQVADTGALASVVAGSSGVGSDATKNIASDAAKSVADAAANAFAKPVMPSLISVDVLSIGNGQGL